MLKDSHPNAEYSLIRRTTARVYSSGGAPRAATAATATAATMCSKRNGENPTTQGHGCLHLQGQLAATGSLLRGYMLYIYIYI